MDTIWLIRHAEKPDGTNLGIRSDGQQDPESLIVRGWQRAGAWTVYFQALPSPPQQVYAADYKKEHTVDGKLGSKSRRPYETVEMTAARLGFGTPDVTYTKGQEQDLAAALAQRSGTTLVAWQHEAIPQIAQYLVGPNGAPAIPDPWPGDRFDVIWQFQRPDRSQPFAFTQICPCLLAGDSSQPIAP